VRDLGDRVLAHLDPDASTPAPVAGEVAVPEAVRDGGVSVTVEPSADGGATVTVIGKDRVGMLADTAAMFALQRASVRAARAWPQGPYAVSVWEIADEHVDPAVLRQRFEAIADGRVDPTHRLRPADSPALAPTVGIRADASRQATVLEVRAADRPGTVHLVCAALARMGLTVRSAHVDTLGPQAVDVFYVQEVDAGALSDHRAADAAHAVRAALTA
jgi:[protein-PII] uridylyltransferase